MLILRHDRPPSVRAGHCIFARHSADCKFARDEFLTTGQISLGEAVPSSGPGLLGMALMCWKWRSGSLESLPHSGLIHSVIRRVVTNSEHRRRVTRGTDNPVYRWKALCRRP